jgi:acyl-CoA synthetase (AMP-forming)/AMP-acid ligase II
VPDESPQPPLTIHEIIMSDSVCSGNSAIEDVKGRKMTYGQLQEHTHRFVGGLNSVGFRRNDRIAIVMPDGPELATTLVSVASGFTAIPLNPAYAAKEFEQYLSNIKAKTLLVEGGSRSPSKEAAKGLGMEVFELTLRDEGRAGSFALTALESRGKEEPDFAKPDEIAFVLLTSGTTALPKRIPLTNANIGWGMHYLSRLSGLTASDRILIMMPFFHIGGTYLILRALYSRGTAICTPGFHPSEFFRWIDQTRPTMYMGTPTMHQIIMELAKHNMDIVTRSSLKWIRTGSASLPLRVMKELENTFGVPVVEGYGSTETIGIGASPPPPRVHKHAAVIPCIPEIAIRDESGKVRLKGEIGEIVVRGPNVFKGYEDDLEANKAAFVDGWFRTGDLGFFDDEGYLHIAGRVKEIINKGGEKIAPFEIDEALMEHPAVADAVTFPIPTRRLGRMSMLLLCSI